MRTYAFIVAASGLVAIASAQVAYDNFGPSDSFDPGLGYRVSGSAGGGDPGYIQPAFGFTSLTGGQVSQITVALFHRSGPDSYNLLFRSDAAGSPGNVLSSWSLSVPSLPGSATTLSIVNGPLLNASSFYWLSIEAGNVATHGTWMWNSTSTVGMGSLRLSPTGSWSVPESNVNSAMRVMVAPVPEPTTFTALTLALLCRYRKRKK